MVQYKEDPTNCSKMCVCVQSVFCFYCPVGFSSFSVPLPQRLGNAREHNTDNGLSLPLGKVDFVGNPCSEFCFCHVSSPTGCEAISLPPNPLIEPVT